MTVEVNADSFANTFRKYAEIYSQRSGSGKGIGVIVVERAGKLAYELWKQTVAASPTIAQITADVHKLGWRIPKEFPDGRLGRGTPRQWAGEAIRDLPKVRGRKTTERKALEASIRHQRPTLQQMQAFVIRHRSRHIGRASFVASGWLGAIEDLGGHATGTPRNARFGGASIRGDTIYLVNDTPGCSEADEKHHFVQKAIDEQTRDMTQYVVTRLQQEREAA